MVVITSIIVLVIMIFSSRLVAPRFRSMPGFVVVADHRRTGALLRRRSVGRMNNPDIIYSKPIKDRTAKSE